MCVDRYILCTHTHTLLCLRLHFFTFSTKRIAKKLHKDRVFGVKIVVCIAMYFYKH